MSDYTDVAEAIRFAEEYGYNKWSGAQDALNRLTKAARAARKIAQRVVEDPTVIGRRTGTTPRLYDITPQVLRAIKDDVEEVRW
jgi:hypothetical protein